MTCRVRIAQPPTERTDAMLATLPKHAWYAVMTNPAREVDAAKWLRRGGYKVALPMRRERREFVRDKRRMVLRTVKVWLPGYLFARVDEGQDIAGINATQYVSTVVFVGDEPVPIADAELDELRAWLRSQKAPKPHSIELYAPGDRIEYTGDSVYVGYTGTVIVDTGTKIRIFSPQISANPVTVTKRHYVGLIEPAHRVA